MSDTVQMVGPDSQQVYAVPAAQQDAYAKAGYTPYKGLAIDEGSIRNRVESWRDNAYGAVQSWSSGELDSFPGVNSLVNTFAPESVRKTYFENIAKGQAEHPTAFKIGSFLGTLSGYALGDRGLGKVLGPAASSAMPVVSNIARSAAVSAGVGSAQQFDEMATKHALDPEGQEKLGFSYGHLALDTALGAAGGALGEGISRIGRLGTRVQKSGQTRMATAILDDDARMNLAQQGKQSAIDYADGLSANAQGKDGVVRAIRTDLDSAQKEIESVGTLVKSKRLTFEEMDGLTERVQSIVGAADHPGQDMFAPMRDRLLKARELMDEGRTGEADALMPNMHDLQDMYNDFYKKVNWDNVAAHPHSDSFRKAGEEVSRTANEMVQRVAGAQQMGRLQHAKLQFSNTAELTRLMSKDELKTLGDITSKAVQGAAFSAMMAGTGFIPGTILGAGGKGLFYSTVFGLNNYATGQVIKGLGKAMSATDRVFTSAITAGLVKGAQVEAHDMILGHHYGDLASKIESASRNPLTSSAAHHEALIDHGVPEATADKLALQNRAMFQAAEEARPKRQGAPDMVTQAQPDPMAQRKWVGYVRSAQDATYALRNATKANLDAARRFSPQVMQTVQNTVHEQVAKNPQLNINAKMWSSRVLGRPVSNIASPTFFQSLRQQRAAVEAQAQQQAQPQRSAQGNNRLQSEQTRLGELSGG